MAVLPCILGVFKISRLYCLSDKVEAMVGPGARRAWRSILNFLNLRPSLISILHHAAMRWPPWSSSIEDDGAKAPRKHDFGSWSAPVLPNDWKYYTGPQVVIPTVVMTSSILIGRRLYKLYLRRIPGALKISTSFWRKRSLFGKVTSVGDGDGFRLYHTPGGRLTGWGWFPGRRAPTGRALKDNTVSNFT